MLTYFSDGVLREERNFKNGKLHGQYKLWHDIDELGVSGTHLEGLKHGEWRKSERGMLIVEQYDRGTLLSAEFEN